MIRKILIPALACLLFSPTSAQQLTEQWVRIFEGQGKTPDRIAAVTSDVSGNIYVAGYAGSHHGAPDAFAMKRNPAGDTLWTYYYDSGTNNEDYAFDIEVDNAGNTYITGQSQDVPGVANCFTAKILPSGNQAWATQYVAGTNLESRGNALTVDALGNVYIAGAIDPISGSMDWLVIKYNSSGVQQWVDIINGPGNGDDEAFDIVIAPNGNPTVCGYTYSIAASGLTNSFVKQYTPANGTVFTDVWSNPSINGIDRAYGLGYNNAGDLFLGGESQHVTTSNYESFAIKYNAAGIQQWATVYSDASSAGGEYIRKVVVDSDGNVFCTGTDYLDGYITKINSDGSQGWRKKWKGPLSNGYDVFHGMTIDNIGNIYTTGRGVYPGENYYGNGGLPNIIITKYNSNGDSLWTYRCADSLNSSMGFAISYRDGKLFAGGFVTDTADVDENLFTIVVDTSGNAVTEWSYNGQGDALTSGQFVATDVDNNIYCAATIDRLYYKGYDVALIKYDPAGNLLWEKYYSSYGWNNDTLTAMQIDPSGNLILCISTDSAATKLKYKLSLLKVDQNGNFLDTVWYNPPPVGSTLARSMAIRNDGSVVIGAGSSLGGIVMFFDPSLNAMWTAKIDSVTPAQTQVNSVALFPNGDIAVGGFSQSANGNVGLVQRYTSAGVKLWTAIVDSVNVFDEVRDVTVSSSGDVAFTGYSGNSNTSLALVGIVNGVTGNLAWRQVYNPSTSNESGVKVRFSPAGNVVFICRGWTGFVSRYFTVQYSGTGVFQWAMIYSNTASDREPVDLIVEPSNRVVTAGWAINGFTTNYDYVLAGYSPTGTVEFINTFTTSTLVSFSWEQLRDLERDAMGDLIVTGHTSWEFFNDYLRKILTIKYGGSGVGMEEYVTPGSSLTVFPNPSYTGKFTLLDANPTPMTSGKVYDMQGRLISALDITSEEIDLNGRHSGLYILVIERDGAQPERIKLVIQ